MNTSASNQFMTRIWNEIPVEQMPVEQKDLLYPQDTSWSGYYCIYNMQIILEEQMIPDFHVFSLEDFSPE